MRVSRDLREGSLWKWIGDKRGDVGFRSVPLRMVEG
ncbi:hypothetical protein LINGRAHAP2_LOCUS17934 [Linum grandiflorum]